MSLVDTAVVGARSSVELAALGPGTSVCDNVAYMCGFLAQVYVGAVRVVRFVGDVRFLSGVGKEREWQCVWYAQHDVEHGSTSHGSFLS